MPRATTAAWDVMPPRVVRIPSAACMPWMSSGEVSTRTRMTLWPAFLAASASSELNTISPQAAPGEAGRPDAKILRSAFGSIIGMEQLVERGRLDAHDRPLPRDQAFACELHRDAQRRLRGALAVARLEHPELAGLDREFHVLHVTVMLFENAVDAHEFGIGLRHRAFHRGLVGARCDARALGDVLRRADARHHVLALRVDEKLAVELALAGRRIARERDAGGGGLAHVAEHHRLHVHRRAPARRNGVKLAVFDRAVVHPRAEHRADGAPELLLRILRETACRAASRRWPCSAESAPSSRRPSCRCRGYSRGGPCTRRGPPRNDGARFRAPRSNTW